MTNDESSNQSDIKFLINKIESIENRLTGIESMLKIEWVGQNKDGGKIEADLEKNEDNINHTESTIVEYGLAWLGTIVLIFGLVFLTSYLDNLGYAILSSVTSFGATFLLIGITFKIKNTFPILGNVLILCTPLLLFYNTLNLHYFSDQPILANHTIELFFLLLLVALQFALALRKNSELLCSIAILLSSTTAIFSDSTYITLSILVVTSIIALILFYKKLWWRTLLFTLFIVYTTHLIWLFNNPLIGNPLEIVEQPQNNIIFLFTSGIIYTLTIFIKKEKIESNGILLSITVWNAIAFSFVLLMVIIPFYQESYEWICGGIGVTCLLYGILLKIKDSRSFAPATYACFGFVSLSIAIYGFAGLPNTYLLLVFQSFLVVSMSLWFRSQIIVIANSLLFIFILLLYLITSTHTDPINFAFAITALATARILNWKKERLTLKTEIFRNIFLAIAFIMILYSWSMALPNQYVTLSWTTTAIGFFILSLLLKNIKYRYLSILTIVVTAGHLFFVDLSQLEIGYRVIAFMAFAIISLGVSLYYTKRIHHKHPS